MLTFALLALPLLKPITPGMVVTQTTKFDRGTYLIPTPEDLSTPVMTVKGDNITVDFSGAVLRGSPETANPDQRKGIGIRIEGKNVTIKNAKVYGYKVGLIARNSSGLKILDSDFSYNWKQHLGSTPEREDLNDWMSYHHNEKDEWLRNGAGMYLRGCDGFEVKNTKVVGGQCGLMLTESNDGKVWNDNFSFLSGIGLGMYKSSRNMVMHNNIDWCVRGYSHGVYNRGQDSAGILIYEQSNANIFAYNSVTHGGDGFFLWAGQTTMDNGQGGCNNNLVYGNDFSHAPTNGIEATFSQNNFVNNLVLECWHGVWGGYSYNTRFSGNVFGLNAEAIAIEHGHDIAINSNTFYRDLTAIHLWANPNEDPNWGFPKFHKTESKDYTINDNYFSNITTNALDISQTEGVEMERNRFESNGHLFKFGEDVDDVDFDKNTINWSATETLPHGERNTINVGNFKPMASTMKPSGQPVASQDPEVKDYLARFDVYWEGFKTGEERFKDIEDLGPTAMKGGMNPFIPKGELRGRRYIIVDEWGPYDFQRPLLQPRDVTTEANGTATQRFEILGPKGKWKIKDAVGFRTTVQSGTVPGFIDVTTDPNAQGLVKLDLEYVGEKTTDVRGVVTPAGKPITFGYQKFRAPIDWDVKFYPWTPDSDPRTKAEAFAATLKGKPLVETKTQNLDYAGYGAFTKGVPATYFSTIAEGTFMIPTGNYTLEVITDDGCRVSVDGKPVITDAWKYQGPTTYTANLHLEGGVLHKIHVEHFQIDGYSQLKVALRPASP